MKTALRVLNLMDIITTLTGLALGAHEINPGAVWLLSHGWMFFAAVKIAWCELAVRLLRRQMMVALCALYSIVVLSNLYVLWRLA